MELSFHHIVSQKNWADIVLNPSTSQQITQLLYWVKQQRSADHKTDGLKQGYRAFFYGPPGTGKSLTAALMAKESGREVYRIDLSQVVSKYIGETEKNLEPLFAYAEEKGWILFFDEADALFGKRTEVKDAHDKYASMDASRLIQRIESYKGLAIFSSRFKPNIDDAFIRRFQSVIHFPLLTSEERKRIWEIGLSANNLFKENIDLDPIAVNYELSPAAIMNVVNHVTETSPTITHDILISGIRREYNKMKKDI